MPYAHDHIGIYKIVNNSTGNCYVGQSQRVKKRVKEHFRLLDKGCHPNQHLQRSYNKYGKASFTWALEVECEDVADLDKIEESFLTGDAQFDEPVTYNIADFAKAPMRGKSHTNETKAKIRASIAKNPRDTQNPLWREKLRQAKKEYYFSNPEWVAKLKFIIDNPSMSYAERARRVGKDISTTRKLYLKYQHLQGVI